MCDKNTNEILNIDFSSVDDVLYWFNDSTNPIETAGGKLILRPSSQTSVFTRLIGNLDPDNNRLKIKLNFEVLRPLTGGNEKLKYSLEFWMGSTLIGSETVTQKNIKIGEVVKVSIDRDYVYKELSGTVSIKIKPLIGWENEIRLQLLQVYDENFCPQLRTYFVIDQLLEESRDAQSGAIRLLQWKVDGLETLTNDFALYNSIQLGKNPAADWYFATADIDGANRSAATTPQVATSFNPFVKELGLVYNPAKYYSGKPTGTITGKDFGAGLLQLGVDKPEILNTNRISKKGAFFIDIDYEKPLFIEMEIVINKASASPYDNPDSVRRYFIIWDLKKTEFYFINQQNNTGKIEQIENGFLAGLTEPKKEPVNLACGSTVSYSGEAGEQVMVFNLGDDPGNVDINYEVFGDAAKFEAVYGDVIKTSGYVGDDKDDQFLINHGVQPKDIKTGGASSGVLTIPVDGVNKTIAVNVNSLLPASSWTLTVSCPTS